MARRLATGTESSSGTAAEPHALTTLLHAKLKAGAVNADGVCEALGITAIYLRSLLNGHRRWGALPVDKLRALADLLEIKPRLSVFAMAGVVQPEDWLAGPLHDVLRDQYEAMSRDAKVSGLLPSREAWQRLNVETQRLIVMLWLEILQLRTSLIRDEEPAREKVDLSQIEPPDPIRPLEF